MHRFIASSLAAALVTSLLGLGAGLGGCASSRIQTTWTDPTAVGKPLDFQKVAAVALLQDGALRRVAEDELVRAIREGEDGPRGVEALPSYTLLDSDDLDDPERARAKLAAAGFDGAAVVSVLDSQQRVNYVPGMPTSYGFGYGWTMYDPGYVTTDTVVYVQTNIYDLADKKLLWSGTTENYNPRDIKDLIDDTAHDVGGALRKEGMIR